MRSRFARFASLAALLTLSACASLTVGAPRGVPVVGAGAALHGLPMGSPYRSQEELDSALHDALRQALRASGRAKAAAAAPSGTGAVVDDLALAVQIDGSVDFAWSFRSPGDYDQNGQVNISDLTPVGISFGKTDGAADWAKHEPVDGDSNGAITIADVTPIGQNFNRVLSGYELQSSATPANEASWQSTGAEASLASAQTPAGGGRKTFALTLPASDPHLVDGTYFRVVPFQGDGAGREYGQPGLSVQFDGGGGPNNPPIAVLEAEPGSGLAPLTVLLSANDSGDIDGTIAKYEVDFDGPIGGELWTEMGLGGLLEHTYDTPGAYLCSLRVTDDRGATDTDVALIKVRTETPPIAALTGQPVSGPTPLHVVWDASTSADPDGLIVKYEWDFDNDEQYDYDSGALPTADFYYYEAGDFPVTVRVTDTDGLTSTASSQASPTLGASWHVQELPYTATDVSGVQFLEVQGKPGIFYYDNDGSEGAHTYFIIGADAQGSAWEDPVALPESNPGFNDGDLVSLVSGRPAITTPDGYYLSGMSEGQTWFAPTPLENSTGPLAFILTPQKPLILDTELVFRGSNALGTSWVEAGHRFGFTKHASGALVSGLPATVGASYYDEDSLIYEQCANLEGSIWLPPVIADKGGKYKDTALLEVAGSPVVLYADDKVATLYLSRGLDPAGREWSTPRGLYTPIRYSIDATKYDGRILIACCNKQDEAVIAMFSNDSSAESWGFPSIVAPDVTPSLFPQGLVVAEVSGVPSIVMTDFIPGPDVHILYAQYR